MLLFLKNLLPVRSWLILGGVLVLIVLTLAWCEAREDAQRAGDRVTITDARMGSAEKAIETLGDNADAHDATDAQVKEAQDAIARETDPAERDRVARCELRKLQHPEATC